MFKNLKISIALIIVVILNSSNGFTYQKIYRNTEICGNLNGHRRYLELGETGDILAHNITIPNVNEIEN